MPAALLVGLIAIWLVVCLLVFALCMTSASAERADAQPSPEPWVEDPIGGDVLSSA